MVNMASKDSVSKSVLDVVSEAPDTHRPGPSDAETGARSDSENGSDKTAPPLVAKLFAVFLISCISFGSHWSSGVTGAMKSTIKEVLQTRNHISYEERVNRYRRWISTTSSSRSLKRARTLWPLSSSYPVASSPIELEALVRFSRMQYSEIPS